MATRWGCLGVGKIANDFFMAITTILPRSEHELVAVAARDLERAQSFADKLKFKKAYGSYDELASDENVEVVYVGTIASTHAELCIKMMDAGKHVLCEKPLALNLKQTKEVLEASRRNNVLFVEGWWNRFFPVFARIRQELAYKTLGTVKMVQAQNFLQVSHEDRFQRTDRGGGCIEFGSYLIALACMVYDEMPETITAVGNIMQSGVDESGCILLKYQNGAMAALMYHTSLPYGNSAVVYGDKGEIKLEQSLRAPTKVTTPSGTYDFPIKGANQTEGYNYPSTQGFQYEAEAIRNYIKSGATEAKEVPHRHTEMISAIMDNVRKQIGVLYPCNL